MRILLLNPTKQARKTIDRLAKNLPKHGIEVVIVAPKGFNEKYDTGVKVREYDTIVIPGVRYQIPGFHYIYLMVDIIGDVDIVISASCLYISNFVGALISNIYNTPFISTVDALPGLNWKYGKNFVDIIAEVYTKSIGKFTLDLSTTVVGLGEYIQEDVSQLTNSRIEIIPNGVDIEKFTISENKCKNNTKDINILYVGRLDTVKNVGESIKSIKYLRNNGYNVSFDIVGEGAQEEKYRGIVKSLELEENVTFHGWVDHSNIHKYYRTADVFVLSSTSEGQPSVLLEAQASGLPVIAPDVGGISEMVFAGSMLNNNSASNIAAAIVKLHESNEMAPETTAREKIIDEYSDKSMINKYLGLIDDIIAQKNSSVD